jgi:hypothetical protein
LHHPTSVFGLNVKNSYAEEKIRVRIPIDRNRRERASRIEASSSTAKTIGSSEFTRHLPSQLAIIDVTEQLIGAGA